MTWLYISVELKIQYTNILKKCRHIFSKNKQFNALYLIEFYICIVCAFMASIQANSNSTTFNLFTKRLLQQIYLLLLELSDYHIKVIYNLAHPIMISL
jgi:hypothetical protein